MDDKDCPSFLVIQFLLESKNDMKFNVVISMLGMFLLHNCLYIRSLLWMYNVIALISKYNPIDVVKLALQTSSLKSILLILY